MITELENTTNGFKSSESYIKFEKTFSGDIKQTTYNKKQYEEFKKKERENKKSSNIDEEIGMYTLPTEKTWSWMKLTLEAIPYMYPGEYKFVANYDWLEKPFFTMADVFSIGHDSTITFDNTTARGYFECEQVYPTYDLMSEWKYFSSSDCLTDVSGVAFKFDLQTVADSSAAFYSGFVAVDGSLLQSSGNLQVTYGHAELAFNYSIDDVVQFLLSGAISFNPTGAETVIGFGDRLVK